MNQSTVRMMVGVFFGVFITLGLLSLFSDSNDSEVVAEQFEQEGIIINAEYLRETGNPFSVEKPTVPLEIKSGWVRYVVKNANPRGNYHSSVSVEDWKRIFSLKETKKIKKGKK